MTNTSLKFDDQFEDAICMGDKIQTVRQQAHCKVGDSVDLTTSDGELIQTVTVQSIEKVSINAVEMQLGGIQLFSHLYARDQDEPTDNEFAQACGFSCFSEMVGCVKDTYEIPFQGVVIRWDDYSWQRD